MLKRRARPRLWQSRVAVLFVVTIFLTGCDELMSVAQRFLLNTDDIIVEQRPDPAYERLFPYYVELCTLSQWSRVDGSRRGNPFGHAVMYIKGACKDDDAPYPRLRRCRDVATSIDDPEHGAGISVGQWFRNVNWVAVPGHHLFYDGNLAPGERLTQAHLDATVQEAMDRGVFDGVEFHDGWITGEDRSLRQYITEWSIGTDFALQFSRNLYCARLPVTAPMLDEIIAFLNDKNTEYATGKADYNWNVLANNCVHTLRNALAAANVWAPMSVRQIKLRHLFNLAVPANAFVDLAILGTSEDIADYEEIMEDDASRDALHDFRWLPTRHGALVKALPVHSPNDIYTTDFQLFTVQSPFSMRATQHAVRLMSEPRYADLETNLRFFRDVYTAAIERHDYTREPLASVRGSPYRRVERLDLDYLRTQLQDVDDKLRLLDEPTAAESGDAAKPPSTGETRGPK
jgi:hypothetical protein